MQDVHSLLARQIRRCFKEASSLSDELKPFIQSVNEAYRQSDIDRGMLERALDLSSTELLQANAEMQAVFQAFPDVFIRLDYRGNILDYKGPRGQASVFPLMKPPGETIFDLFDERDRETLRDAISRVAQEGISVALEYDVQTKEAGGMLYEVRLVPLREEQIMVLIRDITESKRSQDALKKANQEWYYIFNAIGHPTIIMDRNHNILAANDATLRLSGLSEGEITSKKCYEVFHGKDRPSVPPGCPLEKLTASGSLETVEMEMEALGGFYIVSCTPVLINEGELSKVIHIATDVTERRLAEQEKEKLQSQFIEAQKMEAVGTLAGGIAHDFNNILMGIQGYNALMLLSLDQGHPHHEKLKNVEQLVRSGADLTKQLLGYARGGKYEVRVTDVGYLMTRTSEMFGRTKREISIDRKYQEDLWNVVVDRGQMEQVFLNLFVNAWQAMPGGGRLFLEASNVVLDGDRAAAHDLKPGRYVRLSVKDTGVGMDEQTRIRVFEPFFTTRAMGRGTGLGLASAYGIIKNHGGCIDVESKRGVGTTFLIYLPASEEREPDGETLSAHGIMRGSETLLLVDDEKTNIETTAELMRQLGYRVYIAGSGQEALAVYAEKKDKIDLVVLDMILPGISGGETYARLKGVNPDVKVLLCSGYSLDDQAKNILAYGCNGFLQKPFRAEDLSRKIQNILHGERGEA